MRGDSVKTAPLECMCMDSSKVRQPAGGVKLGGQYRTTSYKVSIVSSSWSSHIKKTKTIGYMH